jgi:hypothetical protein
MTAPAPVGLVFVGEVFAEGALGPRAILCSAARADLVRSVSDDPYRALASLDACGPLPSACCTHAQSR